MLYLVWSMAVIRVVLSMHCGVHKLADDAQRNDGVHVYCVVVSGAPQQTGCRGLCRWQLKMPLQVRTHHW